MTTIDVQTMAMLTLIVAFLGMAFGGLALFISAVVNRRDLRLFITEQISRPRWRHWILCIAWFAIGVVVANGTTLLRFEAPSTQDQERPLRVNPPGTD